MSQTVRDIDWRSANQKAFCDHMISVACTECVAASTGEIFWTDEKDELLVLFGN
jgi:hypothetical protein